MKRHKHKTARDDRHQARRVIARIQGYWMAGEDAPAHLLLDLAAIRRRAEHKARARELRQ